MREHDDIFAALMAPFESEEVKVRSQAGRQMHYITARTAMNRLDEVLGPANWWDSYVPTEHSVLCSLTVRLPDGQVITKADAGGYAGMSDPGDDDKSGYSDAFKRAAVKFGVGRYLYRDGVPRFVREILRASDREPSPPPEPRREPSHRGNGRGDKDLGEPRTGGALFAWLKKQEEEHGVAVIKPINAWGKKQDLPWKMTEWPAEAIPEAHRRACQVIAEALASRQSIPDREAINRTFTQAEADMTDEQWQAGRE